MKPEKIVGSYEEFCYLWEEHGIRESEALTAIENIEWLKDNPPIMTRTQCQKLKILIANAGQVKELMI